MLTLAGDTNSDCTVALLLHYIFDLGGYSARQLVAHWSAHYPANWVRLAVIEALYQGRYKAISVEQILGLWQRRGQVRQHFNCEFERLVCGNIQSRLTRQLNFNPTTNSYALVSKSATDKNYNYSDRSHIKTSVDTVRSTPVQTVDITAKVVSATNPPKTANCQNQHYQPSNHNQRSHIRGSLLPAPDSSTTQQPIQQFNPTTTKSSDFYTKLKAIAQHN